MELLSAVALVLLTLAGYSAGCVMAAGVRRHLPGLLDLGMVVALWVVAFALREALGHWPALGAAVTVAAAVAALRVTVRRRPDGEVAAARAAEAEGTGIGARWKRFALEMGNVQGRLMMGFFYFAVVSPFALVSRLTGDQGRSAPGAASYWRVREPAPPGVERARSQF